ncbi:MAG: HAD family hydrolase [Actinomycetia bacterium]|nr:HAD family hydrolase [Actinomycetes bacterium]MCP4958067.1 HAD family hydrolase [Actinomycetes bacterium]
MGERLSEVPGFLNTVKGIVFDKDGTLVDLDARWVSFFHNFAGGIATTFDDATLINDLLDAVGVDAQHLIPNGPAAVETGSEIRDRMLDVLTDRGLTVDESRSVVVGAYRQATFGQVKPLGDVTAAFDTLDAVGLKLGIATADDRHNTNFELDSLGVRDLVDSMMCGDDPGPVKPDPGVLDHFCEHWAMTSSQLLFVGDSHQDLATAVAANVRFVAVAPCAASSMPEADAWIESVAELAALFSR